LTAAVTTSVMPNRIAMGAAAVWEPLLAAALTAATIVGLIYMGGRVYTGAILHAGPALSLRDAWKRATPETRATPAVGVSSASTCLPRTRGRRAERTTMARTEQPNHRVFTTVLILAGVGLGILVAVLTKDVIVGVIMGAPLVGVVTQLVKLWSGQGGRHPRHL
jgi:hypothetical protein